MTVVSRRMKYLALPTISHFDAIAQAELWDTLRRWVPLVRRCAVS
jgi:hypothetical protein